MDGQTTAKAAFRVALPPPRVVAIHIALLVLAWSSTFASIEANESLVGEIEADSEFEEVPVPQPNGIAVADAPATVNEILARHGSISFRQTPLHEVVFLLSDLWEINIVAGEQITGEVTGTFVDAPLREVLSAVLTSSGYSYSLAGASLIVLPVDQIGNNHPEFESQTILLPQGLSAQPQSIIDAAKMLLSERGQMQLIGSEAVLVIDTPDRIARVRELLTQLSPRQRIQTPVADANVISESTASGAVGIGDVPGFFPSPIEGAAASATRVVYLAPQFTEASEMVESLTQVLGSDAVVAVYATENRLMVKGSAEAIELAQQAFLQLDRPRAQVRITAMIYDVDLEEIERLGVNWTRAFRSTEALADTAFSAAGSTVDTALSYSTLGAEGVSRLGMRTLSNRFDAAVFLEALDSSSEAKLLADPSITCADRKSASIKIVEKVPILAANPVPGSSVVFAEVTFQDAGVILTVTPRISGDGTIELKVLPEYSVVTGFTGSESNRYPIIDSRTAETTVRIFNGHMFVLGGLRQKTMTETVRGVPYLRDLKYVGKLFRSHDTNVRESELIVFLRPEIISPCDPGSPRDQVAARVAGCGLDSIPYAQYCPQGPYCHDKDCPRHHPRPRVNGGSHELRMLGGEGLCYEPGGDLPDKLFDAPENQFPNVMPLYTPESVSLP